MKRLVTISVILSIFIFIGCSSTLPGGLAASSSPSDYGDFEVLGSAEGSSKGISVFGIQSTKADLRMATDKAINSMNGDAIINVRWYVEQTWWVILPVTTTTVIVKGDVIKYKEANNE